MKQTKSKCGRVIVAAAMIAGGERVRLTWTWEPSSGMTVIIF